jgi:hypothetical protein
VAVNVEFAILIKLKSSAMAFLWLHCAHEEDRVIDLASLREAYDAGYEFIKTKTHEAVVLPFEIIENNAELQKFVPITECAGIQIIIGRGRLGMPTFVYYNGCSKLGLEKIRVDKFEYASF